MSEIYCLIVKKYMQEINWLSAITPAFTGVAYFIIALYVLNNGHPHEDAFILFTYAESFASGDGIRYFEGGPPTEGATDFLWMILLGVLKYFGIDVAVSAALLNAIGVSIISLIIQYFLWNKEKPLLSLLFSGGLSVLVIISPVSTASYGGFSTAFFSSAGAILFLMVYAKNNYWISYIPLVGLLIGLLRPDGVLIGVAASAIGLFYAQRLGFIKKYLYISLLAFGCGAAYFFARYQYFGYLLPLPLYVKSTDASSLPGLNEHFYWAVSNAFLLGGAGIAFLAVKNKINIIASSMPVALLFVALMFATQSQNIDHRFQAPGTTLLFLLVSIFLGNNLVKREYYGVPVVAVALMLSAGFYSYLEKVSASIAYLTNNDYINYFPYYLSRFISGDVKIALTEAGRMAFWASGIKYDLVGLNSPQFAMHKVTPDDIRALSPDLIFIHAAATLNMDFSCLEKKPYCEVSFSDIDNARSDNRFWGDVDFSVRRAPLSVYEFIRVSEKKYSLFLVKYGENYSHVYAIKGAGRISKVDFLNSLQMSFSSNSWISYLDMKSR